MGVPVNYTDHQREMNAEHTVTGLGFFLKSPTSIVGPNGRVVLPFPHRRTDQEAELGVVIGRPATAVARHDALDHVFGYTCLVDVTVRGGEERSTRKSFPGFTPIGPWITTADEVPDPTDLRVQGWVGDELRQDESTAKMVYGVAELIEFISSVVTLETGDIIATGNPRRRRAGGPRGSDPGLHRRHRDARGAGRGLGPRTASAVAASRGRLMPHDEYHLARRELATACRIMAHRTLAEDILGHVSLRVDEQHLLVRCRGPAEAGLAFTEPNDIRLVAAESGEIVDDPTGDYAPPSELPIHTAVLGAKPAVDAVVHAHPPEVVATSIAGLELVACFGAYNIPAARLARGGIAEHPRSVLVRTDALAAGMIQSMGDSPAVILRGHGLVTVGSSVAEAMLRALHVQTLARVSLAVHAVGVSPIPIPDEDFAELPDLGTGFNEATLWRHHVGRPRGQRTRAQTFGRGAVVTMQPTDIEHVTGAVRRGLIPAHLYNDDATFALERDRVFSRTWTFLAHESELPEANDYVVRNILDDSFLVTRDRFGELHVMFNMCVHRGMQVCRAERGTASTFRCPYPRLDVP